MWPRCWTGSGRGEGRLGREKYSLLEPHPAFVGRVPPRGRCRLREIEEGPGRILPPWPFRPPPPRKQCRARRTPPAPRRSAARASRPPPSAAAARGSRRRPRSSATRPLPERSRWNRNSAAIASPAPLTAIGSSGVRTRQNRAALGRPAGRAHPPASPRCAARSPARSAARAPAARRPPPWPPPAWRSRRPGQPFQLELVGRGDIGQRQGAVAEEFRDAGADIDAGPDIADHRVAAPQRRRVGRLHPRHRVEDRRRRSRHRRYSPTAPRRSWPARRARRCPATQSRDQRAPGSTWPRQAP